MEIRSKNLRNFIEDFNLRSDNEKICFNATVYFSTKYNSVQMPTEVYIELSDIENMSMIYLLHPDLEKYFIPTIIYENQVVDYIPDLCLIIKSNLFIYIEFVLSIHPENTYCSSETLQEIHSKKFN